VCALVVMLALRAPACVPPDELARRTATSRPTWRNYQEDIKAQIGATPVAQWRGTLEAAQRDGATVRVTCRLAGPWAQRRSAVPILLREPRGGIHRNQRAECRDGRVTYVFQIGEDAARAALPWIELKYPHGEKRLVLFEDGSWKVTP